MCSEDSGGRGLWPTWILGHFIEKQRYSQGALLDPLELVFNDPNTRIIGIEQVSPNIAKIRYTKTYEFPFNYFRTKFVFYEALLDRKEKKLMIDSYKEDAKRSPIPFVSQYDLHYIDNYGMLNTVRHIYWLNICKKLVATFVFGCEWLLNKYRYWKLHRNRQRLPLTPLHKS